MKGFAAGGILLQMGYYMLVAYMAGSPFFQPPPWVRPPLQAPPAFFNRTRKITLKPGQACAIPLVNVLPRNAEYDRGMVKHVPPAPVPSPEIVSPPAPSCDDVK